ncbi:zinc finger protein 408-like isoform X3 [Cydia pomonella]|nr:zinc finger protein 408-like isoform X3 [Cydia pomonella]
MERHMRASHLPIKCPQCPRVYSKWKYYRQHQKMAHPVLALEPPESRYCVECDMQFPSIMAYKMHVMNQHRSTPKKRWPCPACNKTLNNKDTMKKHYALFHSDKTSYQCPHCGKYLSSKCSLQHHLNSHLNIKLPKDKLCSICGRGFSVTTCCLYHLLHKLPPQHTRRAPQYQAPQGQAVLHLRPWFLDKAHAPVPHVHTHGRAAVRVRALPRRLHAAQPAARALAETAPASAA